MMLVLIPPFSAFHLIRVLSMVVEPVMLVMVVRASLRIYFAKNIKR